MVFGLIKHCESVIYCITFGGGLSIYGTMHTMHTGMDALNDNLSYLVKNNWKIKPPKHSSHITNGKKLKCPKNLNNCMIRNILSNLKLGALVPLRVPSY